MMRIDEATVTMSYISCQLLQKRSDLADEYEHFITDLRNMLNEFADGENCKCNYTYLSDDRIYEFIYKLSCVLCRYKICKTIIALGDEGEE